jgi:hypothetical protein
VKARRVVNALAAGPAFGRGSALLSFALRSFLVLVTAACGFAGAAAISAAFLVSRDAGLAGAAEVLFYGIGGALVAGIGAGYGVARLGSRALSRTAFAAGFILAVLIAGTAWIQRAENAAAPPLPPHATLPVSPVEE